MLTSSPLSVLLLLESNNLYSNQINFLNQFIDKLILSNISLRYTISNISSPSPLSSSSFPSLSSLSSLSPSYPNLIFSFNYQTLLNLPNEITDLTEELIEIYTETDLELRLNEKLINIPNQAIRSVEEYYQEIHKLTVEEKARLSILYLELMGYKEREYLITEYKINYEPDIIEDKKYYSIEPVSMIMTNIYETTTDNIIYKYLNNFLTKQYMSIPLFNINNEEDMKYLTEYVKGEIIFKDLLNKK